MRVAYTPRAASDLRHIKAYIGQHNPAAALRTVRAIRDRIARLAARPRVGRPGRVAGTPHIVAYAAADERIEVLAVIHGA